MSATRRDIVVKEENSIGHDYVIGDVHGSKAGLKALLDRLKPGDRLFIVGDLVDRGRDSIGVIKLLNETQYKTKVFAIRGNHESICLDSIAGLETIACALYSGQSPQEHADALMHFVFTLRKRLTETKTPEQVKALLADEATKLSKISGTKNIDPQQISRAVYALRDSLSNGGSWLVTQFCQELNLGTITITKEKHQLCYARSNSEILLTKEYMKNLPYILLKQGTHPFVMVHADMPFGDQVLLARIKKEQGLSKQEKTYATWARPNDKNTPIAPKGRDAFSILAVVGHNIVTHGKVPAIRHQSNTIDLDVNAQSSDTFLVLDSTTRKATLSNETDNPQLLRVQNEVTQYLEEPLEIAAIQEKIKTLLKTELARLQKKTPADDMNTKDRISFIQDIQNKITQGHSPWRSTLLTYIEERIQSKAGIKNYPWYKKIGKWLSNILLVSTVVGPIAKKVTKGRFFFSTEGETQNVAEDVRDLLKTKQPSQAKTPEKAAPPSNHKPKSPH